MTLPCRVLEDSGPYLPDQSAVLLLAEDQLDEVLQPLLDGHLHIHGIVKLSQ
jgi:hypothetical protein